MSDSWEEQYSMSYDRFRMVLDNAEAELFNFTESLTDEQIDILLRITQGDARVVWQFSGVLATERHRRRMLVPDA